MSMLQRVAMVVVGCGIGSTALAVDVNDTRMLRSPAISAEHIAFSYDNDLWVADRDGKNARRVTSHPGVEALPRFSPDGKTIAFTGEYDGNQDVYTVPTSGGTPTR